MSNVIKPMSTWQSKIPYSFARPLIVTGMPHCKNLYKEMAGIAKSLLHHWKLVVWLPVILPLSQKSCIRDKVSCQTTIPQPIQSNIVRYGFIWLGLTNQHFLALAQPRLTPPKFQLAHDPIQTNVVLRRAFLEWESGLIPIYVHTYVPKYIHIRTYIR